jgi:hypothetical protein
MTPEQYQLLRALRPQGGDGDDPAVAAARAAAEQHPDIIAQLKRERQIDLAMQAAVRAAPVPEGLENAILTAMRAAAGSAETPPALKQSVLEAVQIPHKTAPIVRPRFTRRHWLGLSTAAAAAIAAGGTWWWRTAAFSMQRLSRDLAAISAKGLQLGLMSMDPAAIDGWLNYYKAPRPASLPDKLAVLGRKGCQIYDINGHPVSLECFLLPGMKEIHLFCTPAAGLLNPPAEGATADVRPFEGLTLASWTRAGKTVLMFSHEAPEVVRTLLS